MRDALAWTLIHFVWQGSALGLASFVVLRVVRPERATTRYLVGVATLAAMLLSTAVTFSILSQSPQPAVSDRAAAFITAPSTTTPSVPAESISRHEAADAVIDISDVRQAPSRAASLDPAATSVVVSIWALGVLALSLRLLGGWMLTRRLTRIAVANVAPSVDAAARRIAERLQLRRAVAIVESGAVVVPTLVGWMKPVVLLPAVALSGLTPEQLHAILAHELAHVRRHDYLVNLLQSVVETLLFYHPATWWVSKRVRAEREHCCDDLAVEVCGDRLVYVSALAELTTIANHRAFALAATDGSLIERVQRILGRPQTVKQPAPVWAVLALFVLIAGSTGAFSTSAATEIADAVMPVHHAPSASASPQAPKRDEGATAREIDAYAEKYVAAKQTLAAAIVNAENDRAKVSQPLDAFAYITTQWFRAWFGQEPPTPPAPPEPPAAPTPPAPPEPTSPPEPPAPPAPPASPAAPAPPAPPAPPPAQIESHGSGNMSWSNNGERLTIKWDGDFRISDDDTDIEWIEDGGYFSITDGIVFRNRADLKAVNGRLERTFSKNGVKKAWEPEGREFLAAALGKMIRSSGAFAKERVAKFLKRGGPDAVLEEMSRLSDSSYVRRVYFTELLKQATISEPLLTTILERVPTELKSDYDKATLLTMMAKLPAMTNAHRVQIARATKTIGSDYDQRRTLAAAMDVRPLPADLAAAVLEATESITSNYDRSQVLQDLARRGGLTSSTTAAFMAQVRAMGSSYEQRRVLQSISADGALPAGVAVEAMKSAGVIASSHDQAETLIKLLDAGGLTDASADVFFQSASQISSSYDLQRVLRTVVEQPMSDKIQEAVLRTAAKVNGSYDRANLLEAVAAKGRVSGTSRDLYISATKGMGTHDQNRALAALVRAEPRR